MQTVTQLYEKIADLEEENRLLRSTIDQLQKQALAYAPQYDIAKLMKLYEQEVKEVPELPEGATLQLRARLNFEETMEFIAACGCEVVYRPGDGKELIVTDQLTVEWDGTIAPDLIEYVDACIDTLVVTYGALNAAGVLAIPAWKEVQRSNLSKVFPDGTIHKREDGKVLKPDTYSPADIRQVLIDQGWNDELSDPK